MVPVSAFPEGSIIATLSYIKQYPMCNTFIGTDGLNKRSRFVSITHSLEWTAD